MESKSCRAVNALKAGEVVFATKTVIHVMLDEYKGNFCNYCLKLFDSSIKCLNCRQMYYCDKNCKQFDWNCHRFECPIMSSDMFVPDIQWRQKLLLRLWLCHQSMRMFATKRHQLFDGSDISLNEVKIDDMTNAKAIKEFDNICNRFTSHGLHFNRNQLFQWFSLITTNPSIVPLRSYQSIEFVGEIIGYGLCVGTALLDHSCLPNTAIVTNGLSVELRAMKSIGIGEPITVSFIDLAQNKYKRQTLLQESYQIYCSCDRCNGSMDSLIDSKYYLTIDSIFEFHLKNIFGKRYLPIISTIFGQFNPDLTITLIKSFANKQLNCFETKAKIIESIKVTHGSSHPLFALFVDSFK